ncbi:hypothetical protein DL96DRAFT_791407 [Flagelloscypha sp. PMI_526]|nr:hypothetical protein DL96DRAFT_791407 [Flagelloscypha sp. PMI_526]
MVGIKEETDRRLYSWQKDASPLHSLESISEEFTESRRSALIRENFKRFGRLVTPDRTSLSCPGYRRDDIRMSLSVQACAIFVYDTPQEGEVCKACGKEHFSRPLTPSSALMEDALTDDIEIEQDQPPLHRETSPDALGGPGSSTGCDYSMDFDADSLKQSVQPEDDFYQPDQRYLPSPSPMNSYPTDSGYRHRTSQFPVPSPHIASLSAAHYRPQGPALPQHLAQPSMLQSSNSGSRVNSMKRVRSQAEDINDERAKRPRHSLPHRSLPSPRVHPNAPTPPATDHPSIVRLEPRPMRHRPTSPPLVYPPARTSSSLPLPPIVPVPTLPLSETLASHTRERFSLMSSDGGSFSQLWTASHHNSLPSLGGLSHASPPLEIYHATCHAEATVSVSNLAARLRHDIVSTQPRSRSGTPPPSSTPAVRSTPPHFSLRQSSNSPSPEVLPSGPNVTPPPSSTPAVRSTPPHFSLRQSSNSPSPEVLPSGVKRKAEDSADDPDSALTGTPPAKKIALMAA